MRVKDRGSEYEVSFDAKDAKDFSKTWPGSKVRGSGWFRFDKKNGDIVDLKPSNKDGGDWLAFSQDCQKFGEETLINKGVKLEGVRGAFLRPMNEPDDHGKRGDSLWREALEADEALSSELVRVYGPKRAPDARYWASSRHTDPALLAALKRKLEADKRWRSRPGSNFSEPVRAGRSKTHRDVEFSVDDASGRERIYQTFDEACGLAVAISASSGAMKRVDVLIHSEAGAHWWGGESAVEQYLEDPDASISDAIEITANHIGRIA